jgi:hypothetical protein
MINVLRKPQESDNLSEGIGTMNFLGSPPKLAQRPQPTAAETPPQEPATILFSDAVIEPPSMHDAMSIPPSGESGTPPPLNLQVPSVIGNGTVPLVRKEPPSVLAGGQDANPAEDTLSTLREQQMRRPLSVLPGNMEQSSPLATFNRISLNSTGNTVEQMSKRWSIFNTPVFSAVQNNPIMRRARITNRIGRLANRNGAIMGVTKLRLF